MQANTNTNTTAKSARLVSLDALRGFDMFWIMSGEQIIHALAKTTNWPLFVWFSGQLHHTVWNGITFYDMIFPLFLFIAGVSTPYSLLKKMQAAGVESAGSLPAAEKKKIYLNMLKRTCILLVLGMMVNGLLKFNGYHNIRFASVLGRIGLAWFFAGLIYLNFSIRGQVIWLVLLLLGYWAAMMLIPVPGFGAGVLTMDGSLESYIDRLLLPGRLHDKVHDPEGILSTIPAIGTALLGVLTGSFLQNGRLRLTMFQKACLMAAAGLVLIGAGSVFNLVFPINKRLWSSSFVLYVGGFSLVFLSVFYLVIDVWGFKKWAQPFVWTGANSILIYLCAEGAVDFAHTAGYLFGGLIQAAPVNWQPVWQAVSVTTLQLVLLYWLYRNKIFLKI
jgi:predicted acyltransferase